MREGPHRDLTPNARGPQTKREAGDQFLVGWRGRRRRGRHGEDGAASLQLPQPHNFSSPLVPGPPQAPLGGSLGASWSRSLPTCPLPQTDPTASGWAQAGPQAFQMCHQTTKKMENEKLMQVTVKPSGAGATGPGSRAGHALPGSPEAGRVPSWGCGSLLCQTESRYLGWGPTRVPARSGDLHGHGAGSARYHDSLPSGGDQGHGAPKASENHPGEM